MSRALTLSLFRMTLPMFWVATLSFGTLASASSPDGSLIQCVAQGMDSTIALRIEHRIDSVQAAHDAHPLVKATLIDERENDNYRYRWQADWQEELNSESTRSASRWYKITAPTSVCHSADVSVILNLLDPSHSQVSLQETSQDCGGLSVLRRPRKTSKSLLLEANCEVLPANLH